MFCTISLNDTGFYKRSTNNSPFSIDIYNQLYHMTCTCCWQAKNNVRILKLTMNEGIREEKHLYVL